MSEYKSPIFPDPDDVEFTPDMARQAVDRFYGIGPEREAQLQKVIKQHSNGNYYVPHASLDYGSDFHDHANYKIFSEKYPWLTYCYLDPDRMNLDASRGEGKDFHEFLSGIPEDQWEEFLEDLSSVKHDPFGFSGDLAWELEREEGDRYWREDGHWDLLNEICKRLKNSFHQFIVRLMTVEDTWEILRQQEVYPEAQGEGSVWLDEEKVAEDFDFEMWLTENGKTEAEYSEAWLNQKRRAWRLDHRGIFEKALLYAASQDPEKQKLLADATDEDLFHLLVKVVPDVHGAEGEPRWIFWGWQAEDKNRWFVGMQEVKSIDRPAAALERGLALAAQYAAAHLTGSVFRRPPADHPEFRFEAKESSFDPEDDWDMEQARQWLNMGGYDSANLVYKDEHLRIIIPRTIHTLQKYIPNAEPSFVDKRSGQLYVEDSPVFVCIPAGSPEADAQTARFGFGPFAVVEKADEELVQNWSNISFARRLADKQYGPSLRKGLLTYYRKKARSDFERNFPFLLQVGGFKAVQRSLKRFPPGTDDALDFKIGYAAAKVGALDTASRYFNYPQDLMSKDGFTVVYDDWTDLTFLFDRENRGTAEKVLSGEMDWLSDYAWEWKVDIDDVIGDLKPEHYAQIREVLINRVITDPDDGSELVLTRALVDQLDDETIASYIVDDEQADMEDFRDAIERACKYAYTWNLESAWQTGYQEAIEDVLGKGSWKKYQGKEKMAFLVRWERVQELLDNYAERENGPFAGSLTDLLDYCEEASVREEYDARYDESEDTLFDQLKEQLAEIEPGEYPEDPNQLTLPIRVPSEHKKVSVRIYSEHYPEGASVQMSEAEYERMKQKEPWRFDKEQWDAFWAQQQAESPPAPGLGEAEEFIRWVSCRIDGKHVFHDVDHRSAFLQAVDAGLVTDDDFLGPRHEEGFTTNTGRWLDREEAFTFAKQHGQTTNPDADYFDAMDLKLPEGRVLKVRALGEFPPTELEEGAAYKYGCAMIDLPDGHADFIIQWGRTNIPDEALHQPPDDNL